MGLDRLMSFDMGGTTAKACLIENRKPLVTGSFEVDRMYRFHEGSGMPVTVPSIDMIEIGAGGGSIATVDELGLLKVGPRSAGSKPGPACYGLGGEEPTVTDADLFIGILDAENFLGGDMRLDRAAAELGRSGGLAPGSASTTWTAARGIYRVVAEAMAGATRAHATDRGVDHRGLALLAFGGAGPVHACAGGRAAGEHGGDLPAAGQRAVGVRHPGHAGAARSGAQRAGTAGRARLDGGRPAAWPRWRRRGALLALAEAGCRAGGRARCRFGADLRYVGQQNEVGRSPFDARSAHRNRDADFHRARCSPRAYLAQYGVTPSHVPVEIVSWRLTAKGRDSPVPAGAVHAVGEAVEFRSPNRAIAHIGL